MNVASKLGLPNPINSPEPPPIVDTGFSNFDYNSGAFLNIAKAKVMDLGENLTKTIGRHELKFGGTLQYEHDYTLPDQQYSSGYEDFATLATSLINPSTVGSSYGPLPRTGSNAADYTQSGNVTPAAVGEGDGLLNLGTIGVAETHMVTIAAGIKFKPSCHVEFGAVYATLGCLLVLAGLVAGWREAR